MVGWVLIAYFHLAAKALSRTVRPFLPRAARELNCRPGPRNPKVTFNARFLAKMPAVFDFCPAFPYFSFFSWMQANRCSCSLCLRSPYGSAADHLPTHTHTHTARLRSPPGGLALCLHLAGSGMTRVFCQLNSRCDPAPFEPIRVEISFHLQFGCSRGVFSLTPARISKLPPFLRGRKLNTQGFFAEPINLSKQTNQQTKTSTFLLIICPSENRQVVFWSLNISRSAIQAQ